MSRAIGWRIPSKFSVAHAANCEAGADATLTKLSEVLFAETLRRYVKELPEDQTGWLAGTRDEAVGKSLTLLHHRPAHPWTLAELARETGLSRTVLSERFRHFLGEPPMTYLTRWRLNLGARGLVSTSRSVAQIAIETGYESEAAFNRAFKRQYGLPLPDIAKQRQSSAVKPCADCWQMFSRQAERHRPKRIEWLRLRPALERASSSLSTYDN